MSRITIGVLAISAWLTIGRAQMPSVRGEIGNAGGLGGEYGVLLLDPSTPQSPHRGTLSDSGSFEFDGVTPGGYTCGWCAFRIKQFRSNMFKSRWEPF